MSDADDGVIARVIARVDAASRVVVCRSSWLARRMDIGSIE